MVHLMSSHWHTGIKVKGLLWLVGHCIADPCAGTVGLPRMERWLVREESKAVEVSKPRFGEGVCASAHTAFVRSLRSNAFPERKAE